MSREIEIAMNRLPHHRANVRTTGVKPTLVHFAGDRGTPDVIVFLQHDDIQTSLR